jgi:hypothetical protein
MPRELSSIGLSEKVWKNVSSQKLEKIYEEFGIETAEGEGEEEGWSLFYLHSLEYSL